MRTADFIQTMGVNAHLEDPNSSYGSSNVLAQMAYLGLDNMRVETPTPATLASYITYGQAGMRFDVIPSTSDLALQHARMDSIAPYTSFIEGLNEPNTAGVPYAGLDGVAAAVAFQEDLYAAVKSDPLLANIPVLSFALSVGGSITGVPDITAYADYKNIHGYASDGVPPYYFLNYVDTSITDVVGKPVILSETGYSTLNDGQSGVTQDLQAKWILDTYLQEAVSGVVETYVYQLEDAGSVPATDRENHYGFFTVDGQAKQSAVDLHNLTSILADTGPTASTFTPGTLNYSLSGMPIGYGFNTVFAKSNGSFDIALWSEPQFFDAVNDVELPVTPSQVTVSLGGSYNVSVFDPVVGTAAISTYSNVTSVQVSITTDPLIVEVTPAQVPATVATTPTPSNTPVTLGAGPDSIVLTMAEDAWMGDAQFTFTVDGNQIGGLQTTTALHSLNASQAFTLDGTFGAGPHTIGVSFVNDAYGGSPTTDRNLYVDTIAGGGTTSTVNAELLSDGSQNFAVTLPTAAAASPVTLGTGSDSIVLTVAEDAWMGDAQFTFTVDGNQIGGLQTTTALHSLNASQAFTLDGTFGAGAHTVGVSFVNDAYGGSPATDRNLYVDTIAAGAVTNTVNTELDHNGQQTFAVTLPTSAVATINTDTVAASPSPAFINASGTVNTLTLGADPATVNLVGNNTVQAGTGVDLFNLVAGTAGTDIINGFKTGTDQVHLSGYNLANPVGNVTLSGADSVLNLSNGASVTFVGTHGLTASNFTQ